MMQVHIHPPPLRGSQQTAIFMLSVDIELSPMVQQITAVLIA